MDNLPTSVDSAIVNCIGRMFQITMAGVVVEESARSYASLL